MMPGMPKELKNAKIDDDDLKPVEAIIRSMTREERARPELINGSRRARIAAGSGTTVPEVNRLVKQFSEMQKMMKRFGGGGLGGGRKARRAAKGQGGNPFGGLGGPGQTPDLGDLEALLGGQVPGSDPFGGLGRPK